MPALAVWLCFIVMLGALLFEMSGTETGNTLLFASLFTGPNINIPKWGNWTITVGDGLDGLFGNDYIAGGAGNISKPITLQLLKKGHSVSVIGRNATRPATT